MANKTHKNGVSAAAGYEPRIQESCACLRRSAAAFHLDSFDPVNCTGKTCVEINPTSLSIANVGEKADLITQPMAMAYAQAVLDEVCEPGRASCTLTAGGISHKAECASGPVLKEEAKARPGERICRLTLQTTAHRRMNRSHCNRFATGRPPGRMRALPERLCFHYDLGVYTMMGIPRALSLRSARHRGRRLSSCGCTVFARYSTQQNEPLPSIVYPNAAASFTASVHAYPCTLTAKRHGRLRRAHRGGC